MTTSAFRIRDAVIGDAAEIATLLNEIILLGGSTAIEQEISVAEEADFIANFPTSGTYLVAEEISLGMICGVQILERHPKLPNDIVDIATFVRLNFAGRGVGAQLFDQTLKRNANTGYRQINATIRADNVGGLAYYTRMGFVDFSVQPNVPLANADPVDRISKRYTL